MFIVLAPSTGNQGSWNSGARSNPKLDGLTTKIPSELDQDKRNAMIKEAPQIDADDIIPIPLHRQTLSRGMTKAIDACQRTDGFMLFQAMNQRSEARHARTRAHAVGRRHQGN